MPPSSPFRADAALAQHSVDLCQALLRIDTTNPPGNEREAADLCATELRAGGLEPVILESAPGRANVVARLKATHDVGKPPLLLTAHLDVVGVDPEHWDHPPFAGVIADGCLWGRGAIDMKNMAAMSVAVIKRLAQERVPLDRDLIFAGVADEEAGCKHGSFWLADHHPELVRAEFALGEGGGFNMHLGNKNFFVVQVAEKGVCWVKARVRGEPGHGSLPRPDSSVHKLAAGIERLRKKGLSRRVTPVMRDFVLALAEGQPAALKALLPRLLEPGIAPHLLRLLPDQSVARALGAMLGNTASPTVLRAGSKTNVIPSLAEVDIDGRVLPGTTTEEFLAELQAVLGPEFELEVTNAWNPMVTSPRESSFLDCIHAVMADREPDAPLVPYLMPGFTDATAFTSIGARWYGFAPVKLPKGMKFADMFHGHNERIPVDGLRWGTETLTDLLVRFAGV
ncbi:MAG: M20/M25/M40 family metallo-hydrolase [Sandaracinaceae bacterium]|jgi:acetylornithine deacetylase/succinyl-diaminopimelate desuccinylase-like protein|nr:M20/M25/M40 family metallo-hydrolase [Sandaracinaceae bacterium]MBK6812591.1 M20/M25/M40 family metallo-hydrolase [Sandaracinaceae bacterium]MBK7776968.1 M20/M25/M40 family metallo-hydrolase [Sandaracinaceae bacterium]MBK8409562.1 M20/M25/M40 family metallo-hydrolase [Sandaracinaceae bacterium]